MMFGGVGKLAGDLVDRLFGKEKPASFVPVFSSKPAKLVVPNMPRSDTRFIVVHSSATQPNVDIGATEIDRMHRAKHWLGIGYHRVIRRDGTIELGRQPDTSCGAHAGSAINPISFAICMVGGASDPEGMVPENNFTAEQFAALAVVVRNAKALWPSAEVLGHRDCPGNATACPSFDVRTWWASVSGAH